jgi:hypothetical protein
MLPILTRPLGFALQLPFSLYAALILRKSVPNQIVDIRTDLLTKNKIRNVKIMIHYWKSEKQKLVYDTASGAIVSLTSLEYKMIQAITPPLSPVCPSSLRYELAKYDSADVEEAYAHIYALFQEGILFADNADGTVFLRIGEPYGLTEVNTVAHDVSGILNGKAPQFLLSNQFSPDVAKSICALFY